MVDLKTKFIIVGGLLTFGLMISIFLQQKEGFKQELALVNPSEANVVEPTVGNEAIATIETNTSTTNRGTATNEGTAPNQNQSNVFYSYEGKVIEYTPNSITISVPIDGNRTFTINADTFIKQDDGIALAVGELVDIDVNGNIAYKIETERVIEGMAVIKNVASDSITLERNGKQMTFQKASQFYIDADNYNGSIVGLLADYTITHDNQIISLEIESEYDD